MKHSTGKLTVADVLRFTRLREMGCMCCRIGDTQGLMVKGNKLEIHHLLSGNRRRGHAFTICLCLYHHRGICIHGRAWAQKYLGPSLAYGSKPFHAAYGSDDELLGLSDSLIEVLYL